MDSERTMKASFVASAVRMLSVITSLKLSAYALSIASLDKNPFLSFLVEPPRMIPNTASAREVKRKRRFS